MRAFSSAALLALSRVAASSSPAACSLAQALSGSATCDAAEPAWVAKYSAAAPVEQVHLAVRGAGEVAACWATADATSSLVEWGAASGDLPHSAAGSSRTYAFGAHVSPHLHCAVMSGLAPSTPVFYRVGTNDSWSAEHRFVTDPAPGAADAFPYHVAVWADVGESANAEATVAHLVAAESAQTSLLIGDISYASGCESKGCETWNAFMRMAEPFMARVPTGVALGNHECVGRRACLPTLRRCLAQRLFAPTPSSPRAGTTTSAPTPPATSSSASPRGTALRARPFPRAPTTSTTTHTMRGRRTSSRCPPSSSAARAPTRR